MLAEDEELAENDIKNAFNAAEKKIIRERILSKGIRPDGRGPKDIRPIWCEVDVSPRAHGSAIFTRGETQALDFGNARHIKRCTSPRQPDARKRTPYMHHTNSRFLHRRNSRPARAHSRPRNRDIGSI